MGRMRRLAYLGLKGRKKQTRAMIGSIIMLNAFSIMLLIFQDSFLKSREEQRYQQYGSWTGAIYNGSQKTAEELKNEPVITAAGTISSLGYVMNQGMKNAEGIIGTMDKEAFEIGRIGIIQGRMPSNEGEIAIEKYMLEQLHIEESPGEKIVLQLQYEAGTEVITEERQFLLTGVLENWHYRWMSRGYALPSVIVGGEPIKITGEVGSIHTFFRTEEKDGIYLELPYKMLDRLDGTYVFNQYAFGAGETTIDAFLKGGLILGVTFLISLIVILYLLSNTLRSRKYHLLIMRGMGASVLQLITMILWESVLVWVYAMLPGAAAGCLLSFLLLRGAEAVMNWNIWISINGLYVLVSILFIFLIFLVGNISSILYLSTLRFSASFRPDDVSLLKKTIPSKIKVKRLTPVRMIIRNRKFHRNQTYFRVCLSVLFIILFSICLQSFIKYYREYGQMKERIEYKYVLEADNPEDGIGEAVLGQLKEIPGVLSVQQEQYIKDMENPVRIHWPGWKDSSYIRTYRKYYRSSTIFQNYDKEDYFETAQLTGTSPGNEALLKWYEESIDEGGLDRELFNRGEQCVLILSPYYLSNSGRELEKFTPVTLMDEAESELVGKVYTYEEGKDAIKPGDTLTVATSRGSREITVGGIVLGVTGPPPEYVEENVTPGCNIAVGSEFIYRFFDHAVQDKYNQVTLQSYPGADFAETDRRVDEILNAAIPGYDEDESYLFHNLRLSYEQFMDSDVSKMFRAVVYGMVLFLLFVFVMFQGNQRGLESDRKRAGILQSLGMPSKKLKDLYIVEYLAEGAGICGFSIIALVICRIIQIKTDIGFETARGLMKILSAGGDGAIPWAIYLTVSLLFLLVYITAVYVPLHKILVNTAVNNLRI